MLQSFQNGSFLFGKCGWGPNIDHYQLVTLPIAIDIFDALAFEAKHFSALCARINFDFHFSI